MFLATLLIAIVGTGSGMALGFGKIVTNGHLQAVHQSKRQRKTAAPGHTGRHPVFPFGFAVFTMGNLKSVILTFGFLSMGLRAVVLLVPMLTALFFPGRMGCGYAVASSALGLLAMLAGNWQKVPFDPLFLGIAAACWLRPQG